MDFKTLLDSLPKSTQADWRSAAERLLRGKPVDAISVRDFGGELAPYAFTKDFCTSIAPQRRFGWVAMGKPRRAGAEPIDLALSLGAQGLDLGELVFDPQDASAFSDVRFDYLTTCFSGFETARSIVPREQRAASAIWLPKATPEELSALTRVGFSPTRVATVLSAPVTSAQQPVLGIIREVVAYLSDEANPQQILSHIILLVEVPSDYVQALVQLTALRLLWANVCVSVGVIEPVPPARIYGRVSPHDEATAEGYLIDAAARSVAALSAGVGALLVEPFNDEPQQLRRSITLQQVLALEGHFAVHGDAVRGSAFIESAAIELAESVWSNL